MASYQDLDEVEQRAYNALYDLALGLSEVSDARQILNTTKLSGNWIDVLIQVSLDIGIGEMNHQTRLAPIAQIISESTINVIESLTRIITFMGSDELKNIIHDLLKILRDIDPDHAWSIAEFIVNDCGEGTGIGTSHEWLYMLSALFTHRDAIFEHSLAVFTIAKCLKRSGMPSDLLMGKIAEFTGTMMKKQHAEIEAHPPEAPKNAPLNQYAFSPERKYRKGLNVSIPYEKNNVYEQQLLDAIRGHYNDSEMLSADNAEKIREFLKNGWYEDVFHEPDQSIVYRGMKVKAQYIRDAMNNTEIANEGNEQHAFTFTPFQGSSSWTTSFNTAKSFASNSTNWNGYRLILTARVADNFNRFVIGKGGLYDVGVSDHTGEMEVMGLGPIAVSNIEWKLNEDSDEDD